MKKIFESENGAKMGGALMLARCDVRFSSPFSCTDQKEVTRKLSTCQKRYLTTVFCPSRPTFSTGLKGMQMSKSLKYCVRLLEAPWIHTLTHTQRVYRTPSRGRYIHTHSVRGITVEPRHIHGLGTNMLNNTFSSDASKCFLKSFHRLNVEKESRRICQLVNRTGHVTRQYGAR